MIADAGSARRASSSTCRGASRSAPRSSCSCGRTRTGTSARRRPTSKRRSPRRSCTPAPPTDRRHPRRQSPADFARAAGCGERHLQLGWATLRASQASRSSTSARRSRSCGRAVRTSASCQATRRSRCGAAIFGRSAIRRSRISRSPGAAVVRHRQPALRRSAGPLGSSAVRQQPGTSGPSCRSIASAAARARRLSHEPAAHVRRQPVGRFSKTWGAERRSAIDVGEYRSIAADAPHCAGGSSGRDRHAADSWAGCREYSTRQPRPLHRALIPRPRPQTLEVVRAQ